MKSQLKQLQRTESRIQYLRERGFQVVELWECEFADLVEADETLQETIARSQPLFYRNHRGKTTEEAIINAVQSEELFGMVEVDIMVGVHIYLFDDWIV